MSDKESEVEISSSSSYGSEMLDVFNDQQE